MTTRALAVLQKIRSINESAATADSIIRFSTGGDNLDPQIQKAISHLDPDATLEFDGGVYTYKGTNCDLVRKELGVLGVNIQESEEEEEEEEDEDDKEKDLNESSSLLSDDIRDPYDNLVSCMESDEVDQAKLEELLDALGGAVEESRKKRKGK